MTTTVTPITPTARGRATRDAILTAIATHTAEHGHPPTIREIGAAVGLASTGTVQRQLALLADEGRIVRDPRRARAIHLVGVTDPRRAHLTRIAIDAVTLGPTPLTAEAAARVAAAAIADHLGYPA